MQDGDRNSRYFPTCANQRKKTNVIRKIERGDGSVATSIEEISTLFLKFYQDVFSSSSRTNIQGCLMVMDPKVTEEMNNFPIKEFTVDDIKEAFFK